MPPAAIRWLLPQVSSTFFNNKPKSPMNFESLFLFFVVGIVVLIIVGIVRERFRHEFIVNDGHAGLLYHDGRLIATLAAGRHIRWGRRFSFALVEVRKTL